MCPSTWKIHTNALGFSVDFFTRLNYAVEIGTLRDSTGTKWATEVHECLRKKEKNGRSVLLWHPLCEL